ncbi:MAG TPA: cysteine synthase A [Vicinamibacterales bacterium]|nr:cysteine synthase A [Vicinamibacterales bacterium]
MTYVDWGRRSRVVDNILDSAGLTPMVRLRAIAPHLEILAKLEFIGPSGSVKDRILPRIISEAERQGRLRPGMTIIEGTTGNTGIATAMVAAAKSYPCLIVMPEAMSEERRKVIEAYGAELVLTPGGESDVDLVIEEVRRRVQPQPERFFEVSQFSNPENPVAHYLTTGPEIWEQTDKRVRAFVAAIGTGGTLTGIARYLKEQDPSVRAYGVEPTEAPMLSAERWGSHRIEGIGDGFIPDVLDLAVMDGIVTVSSNEAIAVARKLARTEGIFCGISSGCNVAAALKLGRAHPDLAPIVTIVNDNGLRYLSTELTGVPAEEIRSPERPHGLSATDHRRLVERHLEVIA